MSWLQAIFFTICCISWGVLIPAALYSHQITSENHQKFTPIFLANAVVCFGSTMALIVLSA